MLLLSAMTNNTLDNDPRTFAIIGAAMEVHRVLGSGFLETVYHQALEIELQLRGVPFITEVPYPVIYKNHKLSAHYRIDFVCYESVLVEVKALGQKSAGAEQAQMLNYLKASGHEHALLLNFGTPRLDYRRFIMSSHEEQPAEST